ncbi:MAG: YqaJ-like viral recombinase, partial [Hominilimicola sp.]
FRKTWGDFFPDEEALGGMWDFLGDDFVVEVKTTKRVEDWKGVDGEVEPPIYYKLQACLYAY